MLGEHIGPYEVTGLLGRGGMGEVYRARDPRLDRDVALKILPPDFAADGERLARFEREARLLAGLQHQNIAAIYGLEELDGKPVLVMELVEGDELAVRLGGGALPADEAERIARQLAAGLEYAHEQGVVHRDLKPANVKITPDGRVKILDFGLARALEGSRGASSATAPDDGTITRSRELTGAGAVLGTAAYMSPEQTRGYAVDRRTDIWAFGVILFEMLTGRRLFAGETASDTLAAVLRQEPDWERIPPGTPPVLTQLCRRCLERDPALRLRDIGEARVALEGASSSMMSAVLDAPAAAAAARGGRRPRLPWALAGAAALAALVVGALGLGGRLGSAPPPERLLRTTVLLDPGQGLDLNPADPGPPAISPDGRGLAFTVQDTTGLLALGVRFLDDPQVRVIPGTAGACYPFWNPDSRSVGFFADGKLNVVDVAGGGPVVPLCPAQNPKGGSWNEAGQILFAPAHNTAVWLVDAGGGEPVRITDPAADENFRSHRFPEWLPDGRHFLYLAWHRTAGAQANTADAELRLAAADSSLDVALMPCQTQARYADGQVLYVHQNNLMARPFASSALEFTGPPQAILGDVLSLGAAHCGVFSVSDAGLLSYVGRNASRGETHFVWAGGDRDEAIIDHVTSLQGFRISPDGGRIAVSMVDEQVGAFDIWIHDIARGLATRLTFAQDDEMSPVWSPDGRWVYYAAEMGSRNNCIMRTPAGGGRAEVVVEEMAGDLYVNSLTPDGATVAFTEMNTDGFCIWLQDVAGGEPRRFREVPYGMSDARFSPDGRWIACVSDETSRPEVFVLAVAEDGGRWRISREEGYLPSWSPSGDRIYYLEASGDVLATEVDTDGDNLTVGRTTVVATGVVDAFFPTFAVDPASGRLLLQKLVQDNLNDRIEIVGGWRRLLPRPGV